MDLNMPVMASGMAFESGSLRVQDRSNPPSMRPSTLPLHHHMAYPDDSQGFQLPRKDRKEFFDPRTSRKGSSEPPPKRSKIFISPPIPSSQAAEESVSFSHRSTVTDYIDYWREHQEWPREFFTERTAIMEAEDGREISGGKAGRPQSNSLAGAKRPLSGTTSGLSESERSATDTAASEPRKATAYYRQKKFESTLQQLGVYMRTAAIRVGEDLTGEAKEEYRKLLSTPQKPPTGTVFDEDRFQKLYWDNMEWSVEEVVAELTCLIVPSIKSLVTISGNEALECLVGRRNVMWLYCYVFVKDKYPQPDYCVGFRRSIFSPQQLERFKLILGDDYEKSIFMGPKKMWFPFLVCEVKRDARGLQVAERQNAYSAAHAVRGVIYLFKYSNTEQQLHRRIVAFSVTHTAKEVKIFGHYPLIDGTKIACRVFIIKSFEIQEDDGVSRWLSYQFVKNIYETWMPMHKKRILEALDRTPETTDLTKNRLTGKLYPRLQSALGQSVSQD